MAEAAQTTQTGTQGAVAGDGIAIDPNKSAEDYIKDAEKLYIVPALVREKFPDLIKLVYETESMDQEEREYWLQILPIMTDQQLEKFRGILVNEKDQLSRLDKEYKAGMAKARPVKPLDEEELKKKMEEIKQKEEVSEAEEKAKEAELLEQFDELDQSGS